MRTPTLAMAAALNARSRTSSACSVAVAVAMALARVAVAAAEPPGSHTVHDAALAAQADKISFNIPRQPLSDALADWSRQSGLQILRRDQDSAEEITSPPVSGRYSPVEALERMLAESDLEYQFVNDRTVRIASKMAKAAEAETHTTRAGHDASYLRLAQHDARSSSTEREHNGIKASAAPQITSFSEGGQGTGGSLEEIIVTAQKREERLRDVPMAVSVVDTRALADTNQVRVQDYIARVPGVSFTPSGNGGEPTLVVRGIVTGVEANPTVGYVVDGVPYGASTATGPNVVTPPDMDPGDLARIEVLRGPQGTLYGAASIGGIVQFVTQQPSTDGFSGRLQIGTSAVEHGDDLGFNIRGAINAPLTNDLALRFSAFDLTEPGWIDNVETGAEDANAFESSGGRLALLWHVGGGYSIRLNAFLQDSARQGVSEADLTVGPYQQSFLSGSGTYERRSEGYSATVTGPIGPLELTSITGFSRDEVYNDLDLTAILSSFAQLYYSTDRTLTQINRDTDKLSQEVRFVLPLGGQNELLAGLFYTNEKTGVDADNQAANDTGATVGSIFDNSYTPADFEERAAFFNLTVHPSDRLQLQVGGRASESTQKLRSTFSGPLASLFYPTNPFTTGPQTTDSDAFTYAIAARYEFSSELTAYGRVATGYRPGGTNVACGVRPGVPCQFDADTTQNYELGLKGDVLEGGLGFDIAAYLIVWDNIQIPNLLIPPDFLFSYTDNVSEAESSGVETTFELRPREGLRFWVAGAYNDAHLTADFPASSSIGAVAGDRLPYSPRWSGNAGFDWEFPVAADATLNLGATATHVGDRISNFAVVGGAQELPAYTQVDARAGLELNDWTLSAFVNNIGDERGVLRTAFPFPTYITFIRPRTVGLSISREF